MLHGVKLGRIYGRTEGSVHHVYGKDFEYDRTVGTVKACCGDVDMDIQAPTSVGGHKEERRAAKAEKGEPENIHVKTSGLVYVKKLGVGGNGRARGVQLWNDARQQLPGGRVRTTRAQCAAAAGPSGGDRSAKSHGQPLHLTATKADFDRTSNVATFENAVV